MQQHHCLLRIVCSTTSSILCDCSCPHFLHALVVISTVVLQVTRQRGSHVVRRRALPTQLSVGTVANHADKHGCQHEEAVNLDFSHQHAVQKIHNLHIGDDILVEIQLDTNQSNDKKPVGCVQEAGVGDRSVCIVMDKRDDSGQERQQHSNINV